MASLRDFELGKGPQRQKDDSARPSTAPPRLVETIAPPAFPPPEAALRPSTAVGPPTATTAALMRPVSISDAASGLHAWLRIYARTVNFSNLPLTPQGAMMAQHLKPMPPKDFTGFVSQPPMMTALEAFVATVGEFVQPRPLSSQALPKVDLEELNGKDRALNLKILKKPKGQDDQDFFFEDQKPKLPYVKALPSKVDQLSRPFPEELEERWKGGTLNEDVFQHNREEEARRNGEVYERPDTPLDVVEDHEMPDLEEDVYEVARLTAFQVYASLLQNPQTPLVWEDIHFAAAEFGTLRTEKQRSDDFTEDMKINLTEMSLIAPNGPRSHHWEMVVKPLSGGERKQLEAAYMDRLKPVYEQLGGDVDHPEAACVDFRLFVVVLIGLAKFQDKPKLATMVGESVDQEQARRRLTMAIRVLCPNDGNNEAPKSKKKKKEASNGRRLTEDELFIVILAMHLIFIENSHKLHELVRKKVDIMLSNAAADSDYAESLSTIHFPRLATHGVAATNLVFPTVHEIAALNLENFPDCFRTPKGQELLNRLPRKAKYVSCPPGSVEFLAQEMPEDIPNEDPRGDGSPLLNRREKEHYKGSDFFDPDVVLDKFLKEVNRALDVRKIRNDKRKEAEKQAAIKDAEEASETATAPEAVHEVTSAGEVTTAESDLPPEPILPTPECSADVPVKTEQGEIFEEELDLPPEPFLPTPECSADVPVKTEQGEIFEEELGLPPEPILPTPEWNSDVPVKTEQGEIFEEELDLPPEPILPTPEWNSDVPVKTEQGEISDEELDLPPEPVLPTPEWNLDVPVKKGRGLPQGGALMNLSDDDFDIPPPPQLLSPPARPKTGQDVPRLPLVMQHAHEPQSLLPEVPVPHRDLDDPRYWTYERYQREKSRARFSSSCCSCDTMRESQCKMILLALLLVGFGVLAFGMSSSFTDNVVVEATHALGGVFLFLGCITCCKACIRSQSSEAVEQQLNHPDAAIGRPLMDQSPTALEVLDQYV